MQQDATLCAKSQIINCYSNNLLIVALLACVEGNKAATNYSKNLQGKKKQLGL